MGSKRIVISGQSGTRIAPSIRHFIDNYSAFGQSQQKPKLLKVEDKMKEIYLSEKGAKDSPTVWVDQILNLPIPKLYELWEKAFKSILRDVKKNPKTDIFMSLHCCFYHLYTVEYLSLMRIELIRSFKPTMCITLIDDVYDVHAALRNINEIFNPSYGGANEPVGAVFELLRILDWRSKEIMMTRFLANELGVPHYVFAVKHSYDTFYKLIFKRKPKFYISHPISEVRRLLEQGSEAKAREVIDALHAFEEEASDQFICFLPTTIDELRIKEKTDQGRNSCIPKLGERWDSERYKNHTHMLYTPSQGGPPDPLWNIDLSDPALSELLEVFRSYVESQISSRDHKLVEQCEYLFVYRPYFNGHVSRGAVKEIHYYQLIRSMGHKKDCFIYLPKSDQHELKLMQLKQLLENEIKRGAIECSSVRSVDFDEDEKKQLLAAWNDVNALFELLKTLIDKRTMRVAVDRHGLDSDKSHGAIGLIKECAGAAVKESRKFISEAKHAATVVWEDDNLTPRELVNRIIKQINRRRSIT